MRIKRSKNWNSILIEALGVKAIAFNPILGKIGGGAIAGLFLAQMLYWYQKGVNPKEIYKTIEELEEETCLSRSEQDRAIKVWVEFGVIEKNLRGIPPRRHFRLNFDQLNKLLNDYRRKCNLPDSAERFAGRNHTSCNSQQNNTESYPEISTEKKRIIEKGKKQLIDKMSINSH